MIKNVFLKKLLIDTLFQAISVFNGLIKKKQDRILLYSNEGFRDNIKYLYDYLVENRYNDRYTIYCSMSDYREYKATAPKNVSFICNAAGVFRYLTCGHIYYCFGRLPIIPTDDQIAIQMWHGTSFKGLDESTRKTNSKNKQFYSYVFASSTFFKPIVEKKFACPAERVYICGHPRTDILYNDDTVYELGTYSKNIIWLPTFRKSTSMGYEDVKTDFVVPFYRLEDLDGLDAYLRKINVQIIIKLHPVQDLPDEKERNFTNIQLLSEDEFKNRGYDLYVLMRQMDALITDYSSVFYDYLLLDRPIGFTEDDEEQYRKNRGFIIDNPDEFKPGMRIISKDDIYKFINDLVNGTDDYKEKRHEINDLSNQYQDGKNCERALLASGIR